MTNVVWLVILFVTAFAVGFAAGYYDLLHRERE